MEPTQPPGESAPLQLGEQVGSYRVTRQISHGGMAILFEGQDENGIKVAIKVLRACHLQNSEIVARFAEETRAASLVRRGAKGLVDFYAVLTLPNHSSCIIMEYLEGEPMSARLERQGGHPSAHDIRLFRQLASSLKALHEAGIVHRDVTPKNVIVIADEEIPGGLRCKLIDFGIAKVPTRPSLRTETRVGTFLGNDAYAPPEQRTAAHTVDGKADVYSLGVMLFQLCAGRLPFSGPDFSTAHLYEEPPSLSDCAPHVPEKLCLLIQRMLKKKPGDRPEIAEVVQVLEKCAIDLETAYTNTEPKTRTWFSRMKVAIGAGVLASVPILSLSRQTPPEPNPSDKAINSPAFDLRAIPADMTAIEQLKIADMAENSDAKINVKHIKLTTFPSAFATVRSTDRSVLCKITPTKPCEVDVPEQFDDLILTVESDKFKKKTLILNIRQQTYATIRLEYKKSFNPMLP